MESDTTYQPEDSLTVMECCALFQEKFGYSESSFFRNHNKLIQYNVSSYKYINGKWVPKKKTIPYKIALGIYKIISGQHDEQTDPPRTKLQKYMKRNIEIAE